MVNKFLLSNRMRNVFKIFSGTFIGQIIQIISTPFIFRIFGATNIGIATYLLAITPLVNAISDLGFCNVLMIEDNDENALKIYRIVSTISLFISLFVSLLITIYNYIFSLNLEGINSIFLFLFLSFDFIMSKQINICYTWLTKKKQYSLLMYNPLIRYGSFSLIAIILGLCGYTLYGYFIANSIANFLSFYRMRRKLPPHTLSFNFTDYKRLFREHTNFINYEMPANLLAQLKNQLPTLLIKSLFGNDLLGYYSACMKILNIPINLVANAMGRVFFQVASELKANSIDAGNFALRNIKKAMKFGIIPIIMLIAFGDVAINLFYGHGYETSGIIIRIVALQSYITFISLTVQGIATIVNQQKYLMNSLIMQVLFCVLSFFIGSKLFNSIYAALILLSIFTVLIYTIYYCYLFKSINISWKSFAIEVCVYYVIILVMSFAFRFIFSFTSIYYIYL